MRISIAAVGDMMIGTDYPKNHLPDDDGVSFLADVAPYLHSADIAFGNLEGVLIDGGEPVPMFGDGSTRRDYTYVDDIVEGVVRVMGKVPEGNEVVLFHGLACKDHPLVLRYNMIGPLPYHRIDDKVTEGRIGLCIQVAERFHGMCTGQLLHRLFTLHAPLIVF